MLSDDANSLSLDGALCGATGDKVMGTVFTTDQRGAYVDIGAKGQAFVPMEELSLSKVDRVRTKTHSLTPHPPHDGASCIIVASQVEGLRRF